MDKYRLVLADPPWHFFNWSADAPKMTHNRARGANKWYPTETLNEIERMVPPTETDAILLLWAISSHLPEAVKLMQAWGFTYKTIAWVWLKTTKAGNPRIGMGYWTRQCTELCLLGTKGKPPVPVYRGEPALITAPRGKQHSGKPFEQYAKIDRLWPNLYPRLEMFARTAQPGWDVFGNEVENSIVLKGEV